MKYLFSSLHQRAANQHSARSSSLATEAVTSLVTISVRKKEKVLWLRCRSRAPQSCSWLHHRFPAQSRSSDIISLCLHFFLSETCLCFYHCFCQGKACSAQGKQMLSCLKFEVLPLFQQDPWRQSAKCSANLLASGGWRLDQQPRLFCDAEDVNSTQLMTDTMVSGR